MKNLSRQVIQEEVQMIINKDIKKFFESIFCIKNEGIYKVIGIFGIKIKVKSKHKEILKFLT
ncbi:MAG: hypothetical protein LBC06_03605, partial [Rickettsiales bacterium]|nr:hypothetical protein [Rickettsiales bacterium]